MMQGPLADWVSPSSATRALSRMSTTCQKTRVFPDGLGNAGFFMRRSCDPVRVFASPVRYAPMRHAERECSSFPSRTTGTTNPVPIFQLSRSRKKPRPREDVVRSIYLGCPESAMQPALFFLPNNGARTAFTVFGLKTCRRFWSFLCRSNSRPLAFSTCTDPCSCKVRNSIFVFDVGLARRLPGENTNTNY